MRWKGRRQSDNIEDRRGQSGGAGFPFPFPSGRSGARRTGRQRGGMSLTTILILLAVMWFFPSLGKMLFGALNPFGGGITNSGRGGDIAMQWPGRSSGQTSGRSGGGLNIPLPGGNNNTRTRQRNPFDTGRNRRTQTQPSAGSKDELSQFVSVVLADNEDVWRAQFRKLGLNYREPKLVIYSGRTRSGCGIGMAQMGPFYCPLDKKIYIDLDFYRELRTKFGAKGDFAQAYVISHEVGHHVQTLLGISGKVQKAKRRSSKRKANAIQVRMELQADCMAGVWANNAQQTKQILEQGDVEEAIRAARAIGDDAIQRRTRGYVVPDSFTHGSSKQRMRWFKIGLKSGSLQSCDTFGARDV